MIDSTLNLFNALLVKNKNSKSNASHELLKRTIKRGFIFSDVVVGNYEENELFNITDSIGLSADEMNNSFHKSWQKIKNASDKELFIEQILHYITTYGYESMGIYSEDTVYIPTEDLDIPSIDVDKIPLKIINGYTEEEFKDKVLELIESGIALKENTIEDIITIIENLNFSKKEIENTSNKEVKSRLYRHFNIVPYNPVEFLRYVVYEATESSLLIKNSDTIKKIRHVMKDGTLSETTTIIKLFNTYKNDYGLENLGKIFLRFKPIFLAFRENKNLRPTINKIRKLAKHHHEPMSEDFLNNITFNLKNRVVIDKEKLEYELDKVNVYRKIRLANSLKFRNSDPTAILYKIRNGKGWIKKFDDSYNTEEVNRVLDIITKSIVKDINENVKDKTIYIPEYINYGLPATEKQFTGHFPSGTCVTVKNDIIFGVFWKNVNDRRIDLDLSAQNIYNEKFGWDGNYRNSERSLMFSGDVVEPTKKGASELFYVKNAVKSAHVMNINYFNYDKSIEVPFNIFVGEEKVNKMRKNYTVNPNNIKAITETSLSRKQKMLGLIIPDRETEGNKFYFCESDIGNSISAGWSRNEINSLNYLLEYYANAFSFNDILNITDANVIHKKVDEEGNEIDIDVDLSPENLEKDTFINILS